MIRFIKSIMINFAQLLESLEMLMEDRMDFLKQQFKDKISTEHDADAKHTDSDKIIDHLATKADPSSNKLNTQWLVNQYRNKAIKQSDAPHIKSTLQDFERVKKGLEKKDLNQYKSVDDLRDAVATQKHVFAKKDKEKKASAVAKGTGLVKMYDKDGVTGYKIPNKECSVKEYGPSGRTKETKWCTASNSSDNMFNSYKGSKYTMHFPNGEVLQFHHQSGQIMDKDDRKVTPEHPKFKDYTHHIHEFLKQTSSEHTGSSLTDKFHTHSESEIEHHITEAEKGIPSGHTRVQNHDDIGGIAGKSKLSDDHFKRLLNLKTVTPSSPWVPPKERLYGNPNLSHDQVGEMIKKINPKNDDGHITSLINNPAVKGEHLDKVANWITHDNAGGLNAKIGFTQNPNLSSKHIDEYIDKRGEEVGSAHYLASNNDITLTKSHQKKLIDINNKSSSPAGLESTLADRHDLHQDTIHHLINNPHGNEHAVAITHNNLLGNPHIELNRDHIKAIIARQPHSGHAVFSSSNPAAKEFHDDVFKNIVEKAKSTPSDYNDGHLIKAATSKNLTGSHIDHLIDSANNWNPKLLQNRKNVALDVAANSTKIASNQVHKIIDHKDASHALSSLVRNPKLTPEHLNKIVEKHKLTDEQKQAVFDHPSTNHDVLHKMYDNGSTLDRSHILHHPAVQLSHFSKALADGPPSMLNHLSDSPFGFIRKNVAMHKNTNQDTLKKLSNDDDFEIATTAKKRLK